jgi:hypothetical protein
MDDDRGLRPLELGRKSHINCWMHAQRRLSVTFRPLIDYLSLYLRSKVIIVFESARWALHLFIAHVVTEGASMNTNYLI